MALRLGTQDGGLPSGLLLADKDAFVGATAAGITGTVTHAHTPQASIGFGNFMVGSVTHTRTPAATEMLKRANYAASLDVTLTMTPAAAMGFNVTASAITGSVTHAQTVSAGLMFGATIAGDVSHGYTVSASLLDYTANYSLAGSVTHGHAIGAGMAYQVASEANATTGSVAHAHAVNASTIFGAIHVGSVAHGHTVDAALDFVTNYTIEGSVLRTHLVSGALAYTTGGQYAIVGSVAHTHTIAASFAGTAAPVAFIPVSTGARVAAVQEKGRTMSINTVGKRMVIS